MEAAAYVVVFITTATIEEAYQISQTLLEQKKAACVNIVAGLDSRFWWQGKIDSARESLLIVKTKAGLLSEVIGLVKGVHSYTVPEIVALPIVGGNPDYLDWIDNSVS